MKALQFLIVFFSLFSECDAVMAQAPANDPCSNPTTLLPGVEVCGESLDNATTQSDEGEKYSTCTTAGTERSVWYHFTALDDSVSLSMYENGTGVITNSYWDASVYSSTTCFPKYSGVGGTGIACAQANDVNNNDKAIVISLTNLTVNQTYTLQVTYKPGNSNAPDYCITYDTAKTCGSCANPCADACVFTYSPTQAQVTSSCTADKATPALEGTQTTTVCYTFIANDLRMNAGILLNNPQTSSICSDVTWDWNLYNSSCSLLQTGTSESPFLGTSSAPLVVGTSYRICYTITSPSTCYADAFYPYVYPNPALPITLLSFTGAQTLDAVNLTWTTESEVNNDFFVVQRSTDGINFDDIGTVDGNGTSIYKHSYAFSDPAPMGGINYYRLLQVDFGALYSPMAATTGDDKGKVHLSEIVAVTFSPVEWYHFSVTPEYASVELLRPGQSYVVIFDQSGVIVYSEVFLSPSTIRIPTNRKAGIWYACVIHEGKKELMGAF
jgi:hypothetical protein